MWKRTFGHVLPAKIQIRLRIRAVWSESSLGTKLDSQGGKVLFFHADNEDWLDCANAQADLSHHSGHMLEGTFSDV